MSEWHQKKFVKWKFCFFFDVTRTNGSTQMPLGCRWLLPKIVSLFHIFHVQKLFSRVEAFLDFELKIKIVLVNLTPKETSNLKWLWLYCIVFSLDYTFIFRVSILLTTFSLGQKRFNFSDKLMWTNFPTNIQHEDSNAKPFNLETPPVTTRPGPLLNQL